MVSRRRSCSAEFVSPFPDGPRVVANGIEVRHFAFGPLDRLAPHEHVRPAVRVLVAGSFEGAFGGRSYRCDSGDVVLLPAGVPHFEHMGGRGGSSVLLTLLSDTSAELATIVDSFSVLRGARARRLSWRLAADWEARDAATPLAIEHHLEELVALASDGDETRKAPLPSGIRLVRQLLDDSVSDPPSLDEVAAHAGLSRAHLARSFRQAMGCSVGEYVRRRRLDRAALMLREGRRDLADVAQAAGFYDQSHFTNAFRRWFGCTPAAFRQAQRRPR